MSVSMSVGAQGPESTHDGQQRIAVVSVATDKVVNMFLCGTPPSNVVARTQSFGQAAGLSISDDDQFQNDVISLRGRLTVV